MKMSRLRPMLLLTFAIASWTGAAAEGVGLEWPVASSPPKKIVLGYAASFPKALYDAFFMSEWDITLHVFDKGLKAFGGYDTEVNATGRSFTFRVPQKAVGKNIISDGGDKSMLPLTLYYREGKIGVWEDEKGYQRGEQVSLILHSTYTGEVGRVRDNPLAGNTHIGTEAVSSPDGKLRCSRQNSPCLDRLYQESRTGPQYCGYSVLRAEPVVRSLARYESEPSPSPVRDRQPVRARTSERT
jgi:hypothetical protein